MSISVVIPHYFADRRPNLRVIVQTLMNGTVTPEEILIWNNEPEHVYVSGALVIQAPRNIGSKARIVAGLMARGDQVLFLDNDTCVFNKTIENLIKWRDGIHHDCVVTLEGRMRRGLVYSHWPKLYGHSLNVPQQVFLSLGRGELVNRRSLHYAMQFFPFEESTKMDDLYLSHAYERAGLNVYVIPCLRGESDLHDLPMGEHAMCREPNFNEERNAVVKIITCDPETLKAQAESA